MQNLASLDLVRIRQLIRVQFEDLHVGASAAQMLFGNPAEGVASRQSTRSARRLLRYSTRCERSTR
jgi:hypothetical protein